MNRIQITKNPMINDRIALDMTAKAVQRWKTEGGSITTQQLQELAGNDYIIHSGTICRNGRKSAGITHKFGRVVETGGHFYVAVGVGMADDWMLADEEGKVIAERYKAIKADNDQKSNERKTRKPSDRKPRGYWTKERILELASQYPDRRSFRVNEKIAYTAACQQKIIHLLPK